MFSYHLAHLVLSTNSTLLKTKMFLAELFETKKFKTDEKVAILLCFNGRVGVRAQQGCT